MKKLLFFILTFSLVLAAGTSFGENPVREIVLKDGSVIRAEVLSFEDGVYSLRSETMGELRLQDSAIKSIRQPEKGGREISESGGMGNTSTGGRQEDIKDLQSSMLSSPQLLGMIFALQEDPDIKDILRDEEVMALIMAGDKERLESNPKFIKLMENPKIRAIIERMTD